MEAASQQHEQRKAFRKRPPATRALFDGGPNPATGSTTKPARNPLHEPADFILELDASALNCGPP